MELLFRTAEKLNNIQKGSKAYMVLVKNISEQWKDTSHTTYFPR